MFHGCATDFKYIFLNRCLENILIFWFIFTYYTYILKCVKSSIVKISVTMCSGQWRSTNPRMEPQVRNILSGFDVFYEFILHLFRTEQTRLKTIKNFKREEGNRK